MNWLKYLPIAMNLIKVLQEIDTNIKKAKSDDNKIDFDELLNIISEGLNEITNIISENANLIEKK